VGGAHSVRVLELDPELGLRVPAAQISSARETLVAPMRVFEPGIFEIPHDDEARRALGFLIVEGLVARDLLLAGNVATELLGEGDLLQPGLSAREDGLLPHKVFWHTLTTTQMAVLNDDFCKRLVNWPQVTAALLERAGRRAHRMAIHQALLELSPAETRLLVLFWHLAERWGHVTPRGIVLRLALTHQLLGQLVGCQRASVTTALKQLCASELLVHRDDGSWLLTGGPPDELHRMNGGRLRHPALSAGERAVPAR
jgi:CRP/FNR family transcriptional regulator, cyclic AMP receptor protein